MARGQATILASSYVFIFASVCLLLEFIFLHYGIDQLLYYDGTPASWVTDDLINGFGAASCVGWFVGFSLLIDWLVFYAFDQFGKSRRALIGATLKLIASVLFNIQPWTALFDKGYGPKGLGVGWSNFVGIVFFHTGNCIDAVGMTSMFNWEKPSSFNNLPVWGMWTYMLATWFLVIADGIAYFATPAINGGTHNTQFYSASGVKFVCPGQIIGSFLLLVGSIIYTVHSHGERSGKGSEAVLREKMLGNEYA